MPLTHIEFSRKGGQAKTEKKRAALRESLKKARAALARKRKQAKRLAL